MDTLKNENSNETSNVEVMPSVTADDKSASFGGSFSPPIVRAGIMPEIKGLELLKEAGSTVDIGKTIKDMFSTIRNMESQLQKVLSINVSLEKDLKASREIIADLRAERVGYIEKITALNEELPSKKELQAEIDHLIEERNNVQPMVRDMRINVENMKKQVQASEDRISELEEEKSDLLKDIIFYEKKLNSAIEKLSYYEKELNVLKGERTINNKKLKSFEKESRRYRDEGFRLTMELANSKSALSELHAKLAETKIMADKSFYDSE